MAAKKSMNHCYRKTKVSTSTGLFTFHDEDVYKCKAKQVCAGKGEVLAPLTKQEDREELRAALNLDDDECFQYFLMQGFHFGVDVELCDGEKVGYTTTGERVENLDDFEWLTPFDYSFVETFFIPVAVFDDDYGDALVANGRYEKPNVKGKFICLKPATRDAAAEPLNGETTFPMTPFAAFGLACCFAATTVVLAIAFVLQGKKLKAAKNIRSYE